MARQLASRALALAFCNVAPGHWGSAAAMGLRALTVGGARSLGGGATRGFSASASEEPPRGACLLSHVWVARARRPRQP
jgi:hypothetical protein